MKGLRTKFDRFCLKHRRVGIPYLMLLVVLGSAAVYLMYRGGMTDVYNVLRFDRALILKGQVWRLITYIFTYGIGQDSIILVILTLFCFFSIGRAVESMWGTLRFNLFYFTGMILIDAFCMLPNVGPANVSYLNMSLLLAYAALYPDSRFLLFFFIPVRAWIFAMIDLGLTLLSVMERLQMGQYLYAMLPLVALINFVLFFGRDVVNILPPAWRRRRKQPKPRFVDQEPVRKTAPKQDKTPYTHRCVACGRTDISHPNLEFRYCSRCKGYFCYCEDHINNHNHVE